MHHIIETKPIDMRSLLIAIILAGSSAFAQEDPAEHKFTLAADISPYTMSGFSIKGSMIPHNMPQKEFHVEVFSMNYPKLFIAQEKANNVDVLDVNVNYAVSFYADHKWNLNRNGWLTGLGIVYLDETANNGFADDNYNLLEVLLRVNYKYYIKDGAFYLNPYIALGGRMKTADDVTIQVGETYTLVKQVALGSLFIGYEF